MATGYYESCIYMTEHVIGEVGQQTNLLWKSLQYKLTNSPVIFVFQDSTHCPPRFVYVYSLNLEMQIKGCDRFKNNPCLLVLWWTFCHVFFVFSWQTTGVVVCATSHVKTCNAQLYLHTLLCIAKSFSFPNITEKYESGN